MSELLINRKCVECRHLLHQNSIIVGGKYYHSGCSPKARQLFADVTNAVFFTPEQMGKIKTLTKYSKADTLQEKIIELCEKGFSY